MNMLETSFCSPLLFPVYYQIRLISRFVFRQAFQALIPIVFIRRSLCGVISRFHLTVDTQVPVCAFPIPNHITDFYRLACIHTGRTKKNSRKISLPAALCSHADFFRNSQRIQKYAKSNRSAVTKIYQAMESVSVAILWSLPADMQLESRSGRPETCGSAAADNKIQILFLFCTLVPSNKFQM